MKEWKIVKEGEKVNERKGACTEGKNVWERSKKGEERSGCGKKGSERREGKGKKKMK